MITAKEAMMKVIEGSAALMFIESVIENAINYGKSTVNYNGEFTELEVNYLRSLGYKMWNNEYTDTWKIDFTGG